MKLLLLNYLRYNDWANQKMCRYLSPVDHEERLHERKYEYITIKKAILHIADSEQTWLYRLNGDNVPHMHTLEIEGSFASICKLIAKNSHEFIAFIEKKEEPFFKAATTYVNLEGKIFTQNNAEIILHCMNHSTFHRGQILNMLRHVGYTDQSASDFIMFLREQEAQSAVES